MFSKYTIAELGTLVADPSRVQMLILLLDGRRHSAGELARAAGLSPQAASAHLARLIDGGLTRVTRIGRERLFELDRPEVGHMLEALGTATRIHRGQEHLPSVPPLRFARTCYDHLAGIVAVRTTRAWLDQGFLVADGKNLELTPTGDQWFRSRGIDTATLRRGRRTFIRGCVDWTERQPHVGGTLGAAWLQHCLAARWVTRMRDTRAVRISDAGSDAFRKFLGSDVLEH